MASRVGIARHRAEVAKTSSIAVIAKAVSENAGGMGRQAAVIAAASGLVLTTGITANAAELTVGQRESAATTLNIAAAPAVTASAAVQIAFESPAVSSAPAPAKPKTVVQSSSLDAKPTQNAAPTASAAQAAPANAAAAPVPVGSGVGAAIVAAAYAQVGVAQDCTALVTNALAAAGINFKGWPNEYKSLGRIVSAAEAQPGDLVYYPQNGNPAPYNQHVAVYVGNGMAVHGGWGPTGMGTTVFSVYIGGIGGVPTPPQAYIAIGR